MTLDFTSNFKKRSLFGLACGLLAWNTLASSATIHEYTSGTPDRSQIYPGVSFKTSNGGPWLNLTFNWFVAENGRASPAAFGTIFLLTQEYTGTPTGLSPLSSGYVAEATVNASGTMYVFDPSVSLQPDTTYYFYANSFNAIFGGGIDPGTTLYATDRGDTQFVTFTTESPNFQLSGDSAPPGAQLPTPEPSCGALVIAGTAFILWRRSRSSTVSSVKATKTTNC